MLESHLITSEQQSAPAQAQHVLPGDHVLVYDTDRFRWHEVQEVMLGSRTKIKIRGADFFFDSSLVRRHERRRRSR
jgi:hypothetical protein